MDHERRKRLLEEIRIGYSGKKKLCKGEPPTRREQEALRFLDPIDVTGVILNEIDFLENQIVQLIYENACLKEDVQKLTESQITPLDTHLDI